MIYFEYIDPLRRQAQWQREQENKSYTLASDGYPAVTWLLDARFRELSDEEIDDFTVRIYNCRTGAEAHEIVLSILRKAQEKWNAFTFAILVMAFGLGFLAMVYG